VGAFRLKVRDFFDGLPDAPVPPFSRGGDIYGFIWWLTSHIPRGKVTTYGALARALGDVRASRAVGVALSRNPFAPMVPCHRVVMGDGSLGGYAWGSEKKAELLRQEGVRVEDGRVELEDYLWEPEEALAKGPLATVAEEQMGFASRERYEDRSFSALVGVDASYSNDSSVGYEEGCAAAVAKFGEEWVVGKACGEVKSPYVPGYFHLREAPLLFAALRDLEAKLGESLVDFFREKEAVLLVDGDGYMHPRRFGLATSVGFALGLPSVGIAKSLLLGEVQGDWVVLRGKGDWRENKNKGKGGWEAGEETEEVKAKAREEGKEGEEEEQEEGGTPFEVLGKVFQGNNPGGKRFYVSSGHGVSLASAADLVKGGYPDVLLRAHLECGGLISK